MSITAALAALPTPSLLLDERRLLRNVERLRAHLDALGVPLRPHLKTPKSVDVARRVLTGGNGPATVSTLREAEVFAAAGVRDIFYAVGIAPQKLPRVLAIRAAGCDLSILVDSPEQAEAVAAASRRAGDAIPALIEIDSDGHRSGLLPDDPLMVAVGRILHEGGAELRGVATHAGDSYGAVGAEALAAFAEQERRAVVDAAAALRAAGLPAPVVSVGATPTACFARDLTGVTEVRAGNFVFFDLVMAGLGVCTTDDIAISVLTTVIGHQRRRGLIIVDAGWMALSRDRSTSAQAVDNQAQCQQMACTWSSACTEKFNWRCYSDVPLEAQATLFCAESKHALYHTDDECDGGGFWSSDDCPNNQFDMRDWKEGKLQNVGNYYWSAGHDTKIQDPSGCGLYDVWGGAKFGEAAPYLQHFTAPINWALD